MSLPPSLSGNAPYIVKLYIQALGGIDAVAVLIVIGGVVGVGDEEDVVVLISVPIVS
mgnify:CR=1 FL=1